MEGRATTSRLGPGNNSQAASVQDRGGCDGGPAASSHAQRLVGHLGPPRWGAMWAGAPPGPGGGPGAAAAPRPLTVRLGAPALAGPGRPLSQQAFPAAPPAMARSASAPQGPPALGPGSAPQGSSLVLRPGPGPGLPGAGLVAAPWLASGSFA
ncbi:unnamed protein product, partial [Prorocentrum cordatum]